mmetsp:Transcript_13785/g.40297  ORF Transcript_13785/g.40297 Transcript_13785/m.40297 type:complete len:212 (-) Transcript_13785:33-668(-)
MKSVVSKTTVGACAIAAAATTCDAFTFVTPASRSCSQVMTSSTGLRMGLFDGVKEAFSAPALERTEIDSARETPIDRWMGWSVKSEAEQQTEQVAAANFVDSMDTSNYVTVELQKPMGIIFEENDEKYGGIFILELKESGAAEQAGSLKAGDQLVAVGSKKVSGMPFDEALGAIVDTEGDSAKLVLFRGAANDFYGPTGASQEWLYEFILS